MKNERRALLGLAVAFLLLAGLVGYAFWKASNAAPSSRLTQDEHATCLVQAHGLPAAHTLSGAMYDLSVLLAHIPPPKHHLTGLQRRQRRAAHDLYRKARRYARLEHKLPPTRHC